MAEKTRGCPACGGMMTVRLGEFQCQQCGSTLPLVQPEEPASRSGYGSSGQGSSAYGSSASSSRPSIQPPHLNDPGAQHRNAPEPAPRNPPPAYATAGVYGGQSESRDGDPLDVEKKIYFGLQCLWVLLLTVVFLLSLPWMGAVMLVSGAIGMAILYWTLFGPELWSKWACLSCSGLGLMGTFGSLFTASSVTSLRMLPQLQGFSDHALQSYNIVSALFSLVWSAWFISILLRDALRKQQGY